MKDETAATAVLIGLCCHSGALRKQLQKVMGTVHLGYHRYVMGLHWNISKNPAKQNKTKTTGNGSLSITCISSVREHLAYFILHRAQTYRGKDLQKGSQMRILATRTYPNTAHLSLPASSNKQLDFISYPWGSEEYLLLVSLISCN